jgi:hypothetical protein
LLTPAGHLLFFRAPFGMWKTDGTLAGSARLLGTSQVDISDLTALGDVLYFAGATETERALWRVNGRTTAAAPLVVVPSGGVAESPDELTAMNDRLLFTQFRPDIGVELWATMPLCGDGRLDPGEQCDSGPCCTPACRLRPSDVVCRSSAGPCDVSETCTGTAAECPDDAKRESVCRFKAGPCDLAESCDGVHDDCPADEKSSAECRPAAGICDSAEQCDGVRDDCPTDEFAPAGITCGDSADPCIRFQCSGNGVCEATDPGCFAGARCILADEQKAFACRTVDGNRKVARIVDLMRRAADRIDAAERAGRSCRPGKQRRKLAAAGRDLDAADRRLERAKPGTMPALCRDELAAIVDEAHARMRDLTTVPACAPACIK